VGGKIQLKEIGSKYAMGNTAGGGPLWFRTRFKGQGPLGRPWGGVEDSNKEKMEFALSFVCSWIPGIFQGENKAALVGKGGVSVLNARRGSAVLLLAHPNPLLWGPPPEYPLGRLPTKAAFVFNFLSPKGGLGTFSGTKNLEKPGGDFFPRFGSGGDSGVGQGWEGGFCGAPSLRARVLAGMGGGGLGCLCCS